MVGMYVVRVWGPLNGTAEQEEAYKKVRRDVALRRLREGGCGLQAQQDYSPGQSGVERNDTLGLGMRPIHPTP